MVHVVKPRPSRKSKAWPWKEVSYMFAASPAELHLMAKKIKLGRTHFRDHPQRPRYNLNPVKRIMAIKAGALESDELHT